MIDFQSSQDPFAKDKSNKLASTLGAISEARASRGKVSRISLRFPTHGLARALQIQQNQHEWTLRQSVSKAFVAEDIQATWLCLRSRGLPRPPALEVTGRLRRQVCTAPNMTRSPHRSSALGACGTKHPSSVAHHRPDQIASLPIHRRSICWKGHHEHHLHFPIEGWHDARVCNWHTQFCRQPNLRETLQGHRQARLVPYETQFPAPQVRSPAVPTRA